MRSRILLSAALGALIGTAALAQDAAPIDPMDRPGGPTAVGGRGADPNLLRRLPSQRQWDASASAQAYVAKAKALAGDDADLKFDFNVYCKPSGGSLTTDRASLGVPEGAPYAPFPAPSPAIVMPPQHLFDNFWWFGNSGVGAWLITTRDGYILFDALDDADEARDVLIGGMKKVGLDPAKIKYMIFGHSHLDHTGGGRYIQELYHPKVIMGRDDWTAYFKSLASGTGQAARIKDHTPMTHDIDAEDGMKVTLGGVTGTIYEMTGHTVGSIGMIVPVTYQGKQHPILLVTAATDVPNRESFVGGYEHIWNEGIKAKVESVMQVHPNTNINLLARTKYVTDHYPPAKNPLLYGADKTRRYLEIMRACTQARMDALGW